MNNNKPKGIYMKTLNKLFKPVVIAVVAAALLAACKSMPLEEQIAVKEPGSWDFRVIGGVRDQYVRVFDGPGKVGWTIIEYGQKHPCNQGFQKAIKTAADGLVQYVIDPDSKSFACDVKTRYIFRTDVNGNPFEGWRTEIKDREKKEFRDMVNIVKYWDEKSEKPSYYLVK
jgi:hypothetical protein